MSPTAPSAVPNPPATESSVTPAPGAVAGARQRVANLLTSSSAGLRSFDRTLEALAQRDWSVSSVARNVERAAHDASSVLQRRARARLRQLDHLPVEALAATVQRSRSAVKTLRSSIDKVATRVGGAKPS